MNPNTGGQSKSAHKSIRRLVGLAIFELNQPMIAEGWGLSTSQCRVGWLLFAVCFVLREGRGEGKVIGPPKTTASNLNTKRGPAKVPLLVGGIPRGAGKNARRAGVQRSTG